MTEQEAIKPLSRTTIAIAGATGFVGRALIQRLQKDYKVIGLTRSVIARNDDVDWRPCDLFNLRQTEAALAGADIAIYLVHSMMPPAKLAQGNFADLDLLLADNFSRAAQKCHVKRIIYLGGLIPNAKLSRHLASRLEVERALSSHEVPCISLRAGLIIGRDGSSFNIMRALVERLPVMICPSWTRTLSQPISLHDVVEVIARVIPRKDLVATHYDIGGSDVMTYIGMMKEIALTLKKKRLFLPITLFSPNLSRLWVWLVTDAPRELIGPLVESLRHPMIARGNELMNALGIQPQSFSQSLQDSLTTVHASDRKKPPRNKTGPSTEAPLNTVCSVQRLPLAQGQTAASVASIYSGWLIVFFRPFIVVQKKEDGSLIFKFRPLLSRFDVPLLKLTFATDRSTVDRQMFYISGGLLLSSKAHPTGRFEFREVLGRESLLVAIFDFVPSLPWWIYKKTQAVLHLFVMNVFRLHLQHLNQRKRP